MTTPRFPNLFLQYPLSTRGCLRTAILCTAQTRSPTRRRGSAAPRHPTAPRSTCPATSTGTGRPSPLASTRKAAPCSRQVGVSSQTSITPKKTQVAIREFLNTWRMVSMRCLMKVKPEQGQPEGLGAEGLAFQFQPCKNMSLNPWNGCCC